MKQGVSINAEQYDLPTAFVLAEVIYSTSTNQLLCSEDVTFTDPVRSVTPSLIFL